MWLVGQQHDSAESEKGKCMCVYTVGESPGVNVCVCVEASWRHNILVWDSKPVIQQSLSLSANYRVEWCEHKHTDAHHWHTAGTHLGHFPVNFNSFFSWNSVF